MTDDIYYDEVNQKYYTTEGIFEGIRNHTFIGNIFLGAGGGDNYKNVTIGSGYRASVIRGLGFSERPSKQECDAMMRTIHIEAYPGRYITVHKDLVDEVQTIFGKLKNLGVDLNKYFGGYVYRTINNPSHPGSNVLSMHSFGCAIDINYNINPFIKRGRPWLTGDDTPNGKIRTMNSPIVKAFAESGWGWGGRYGDYMHFSKANGG